ncbi:hypothetical protein RFI_36168 [Reticulomyxa filosa]|uniref:Uncharacterized protein n=1 Tax=Reticulomyxa filosa TaxID=46433 RepID=X6LJF5_RETFI|nr:hypothetical protein RFI_36168 [Reticulomyxa filosa]|eukprot:ETO01272.1 hypothetical protein RFI_36168 [Reticulomyxa filosa]
MTCAKTSESPIDIQVESAAGKTKMIEMLQFLVNECRQTLYLKGFELYGSMMESERAVEWAKAIAKEYYYDLIGQFQFEDSVKYTLNVVDAGNQTLKTKPNEPITIQVTRKYVPDYLLRSSASGHNEEVLEGEKEEEDVKRQSENVTVENDEMVRNQ